jgi:hypothetical protein
VVYYHDGDGPVAGDRPSGYGPMSAPDAFHTLRALGPEALEPVT